VSSMWRMCGSRERDFGQRDGKGELAQIHADKNVKSKDVTP